MTFAMTLVEVVTNTGLSGYGEAKAQVGSASDNHALVAMITEERWPLLLGRDPGQGSALWEEMYNGTRAHYALSRGRGFPALGFNSLLHELGVELPMVRDRRMDIPDRPGLGVTPNQGFV